MEFLHGIIALLAFIVMMLSGLVAWLYMKQARLLQAVNTLAIAISTPPPAPIPYEEVAAPVEPEQEQTEDDRVSVYEDDDSSTEAEAPAPSPAPEHHDEDTDLTRKTVAELRTLLSGKGIPFNKSDKKPTLISLLQATQ
jgi:hypothetical protein